MANKKKATPSPVDEKVYNVETTYKSKDGLEIPIRINSIIGYEYLSALIEIVAQTVVDDDGYYPYYYNSALYGYMLQFYTDFDKSTGLLNTDKLLYETDIKDVLHKNIEDFQLSIIFDSVDKLIEFKKQKLAINSEIDSTFTGLLNEFRSLLAKANNFLDLDPDVLGKVVNNLAGMEGITESKLVDALLDKSGVTKGKGGRKTGGKGKSKNNVVELPIPLQQTFQDGEINDTEVTE